MLLTTLRGPDAVLRGYFHAKDENRPHLLRDVFSPDDDRLRSGRKHEDSSIHHVRTVGLT